MKAGAENRKKTLTAAALGTVALICIVYAYYTLFGGSSTPVPPPSIVPAHAPAATRASAGRTEETVTQLGGNVPGVAAQVMATTSSSLDPTLDERAMLRTESLVYSGSGRNIFSASYTPPAPLNIPKHMPPARPKAPVYTPPVNLGPPPPPPINLKFFGTAKRVNGALQAFLLQGENVYLAAPGDIVARKYKIVSIGPTSIQVTDLQDNNTQTLPLQKH